MFKDFIYDNRSLSSFGFIVCNFDSDDDIDAVTTDSQREISSLSLFQGKFQPFASTAYSDKMVFEFSCCKNVCWNDELDITVDEMRDVKHWLTPPVAKSLRWPMSRSITNTTGKGYSTFRKYGSGEGVSVLILRLHATDPSDYWKTSSIPAHSKLAEASRSMTVRMTKDISIHQ